MQNEFEELQSPETGSDKAWVVTANMGYGHQRGVYPLKGNCRRRDNNRRYRSISLKRRRKLWKRLLNGYELCQGQGNSNHW